MRARRPRCGHKTVRARCDVCRAWNRTARAVLVEEDGQEIDVLGTDFQALDTAVEKFIRAVASDTHYITDIVEAYNRLPERRRSNMARQDIWTDERTGHTFIITESRNDDGVYFWTVERNTQPPTRLGHVERHERQIFAITTTLPAGEAERHPVQTVEDGWKLITSGA